MASDGLGNGINHKDSSIEAKPQSVTHIGAQAKTSPALAHHALLFVL